MQGKCSNRFLSRMHTDPAQSIVLKLTVEFQHEKLKFHHSQKRQMLLFHQLLTKTCMNTKELLLLQSFKPSKKLEICISLMNQRNTQKNHDNTATLFAYKIINENKIQAIETTNPFDSFNVSLTGILILQNEQEKDTTLNIV